MPTKKKEGVGKGEDSWPLPQADTVTPEQGRKKGDSGARGVVAAYQRCWFDCGKAFSVPVVEGLILDWVGRPQLRPALPVAHLIPYEYMILQKWIKTRRKSSCALSSLAASLSPLFLHKPCCLKCIVWLSASPCSSHSTKWISNTLQPSVRNVSWSLVGCLLNPWQNFFFNLQNYICAKKRIKNTKHRRAVRVLKRACLKHCTQIIPLKTWFPWLAKMLLLLSVLLPPPPLPPLSIEARICHIPLFQPGFSFGLVICSGEEAFLLK